ncbi:MAG TPA: hypothetical protein VGT04_04015 [Acidobacteriaceae bacterium]|nr:hypothetical protein [Acidobacteriaceae bacterium]
MALAHDLRAHAVVEARMTGADRIFEIRHCAACGARALTRRYCLSCAEFEAEYERRRREARAASLFDRLPRVNAGVAPRARLSWMALLVWVGGVLGMAALVYGPIVYVAWRIAR